MGLTGNSRRSGTFAPARLSIPANVKTLRGNCFKIYLLNRRSLQGTRNLGHLTPTLFNTTIPPSFASFSFRERGMNLMRMDKIPGIGIFLPRRFDSSKE